VLSLRIKRAEVALADGRLDEVCKLLRAEDMQAHRRGQDLVRRMTEALIARGQAHLQAGRLEDALADCGRLHELARDHIEATALRMKVHETMEHARREQRRVAGELAAAQASMEQGHIQVARQHLAELDAQSHRVQQLARHLDQRAKVLATSEAEVEQALDAQDWARAAQAWQRVPQRAEPQATEVAHRIIRGLIDSARGALLDGRLDQAQRMSAGLDGLCKDSAEALELRQLVGLCRSARRYVGRGRLRRAVGALRRFHRLVPEATWVTIAIAQAEQAAENLAKLREGPLGLLAGSMDQPVLPHDTASRRPLANSQTHLVDDVNLVHAPLPDCFVLHIDGAGGYLVCTRSSISIGPVSASSRPDVGLVAAPDLPTARVERVDDDYFIASDAAVRVNDRPGQRRLLADGDRIALSHRCRLVFRRPHPASSAAVLEMSGARLVHKGLRAVVLMHRELVISPHANAHIRVGGQCEGVTVSWRGGELRARIHGGGSDGRRPGETVTPGKRLVLGGVALVAIDVAGSAGRREPA
jgi:tetratricopeptide (TPR) repeat protein